MRLQSRKTRVRLVQVTMATSLSSEKAWYVMDPSSFVTGVTWKAFLAALLAKGPATYVQVVRLKMTSRTRENISQLSPRYQRDLPLMPCIYNIIKKHLKQMKSTHRDHLKTRTRQPIDERFRPSSRSRTTSFPYAVLHFNSQ